MENVKGIRRQYMLGLDWNQIQSILRKFIVPIRNVFREYAGIDEVFVIGP